MYYGFEVFTKIDYMKEINTEDILKYAFNSNKIDKIEQILFLNCIQEYVVNKKDVNTVFVNINLNSYESYINKPRIYDFMNKVELVVEFTGYEKYNISHVQDKIDMIHKNNGKVLLNHFGIGTYLMDDISRLNVDYLKLDKSMLKDVVTSTEKQKLISDLVTLCLSKEIKFIVVGVENKEMFNILKKIGVKYMQGFYLDKPKTEINILDKDTIKTITQNSNDVIT
ncbi:MAG: EAL domain-containing protein [Clostridia bacterium]